MNKEPFWCIFLSSGQPVSQWQEESQPFAFKHKLHTFSRAVYVSEHDALPLETEAIQTQKYAN